jgi:soluble lytic murein transglycosylase-like protein
MKEFYFFIIVFCLICFTFNYLENNDEKKEYDYEYYKNKYSWLTPQIYEKTKLKTEKRNIPLSWMLAIYYAESRGNQYAVSKSGALGLGQVMPFHYRGNKHDLFNIDLNIELSTTIFERCMKKNNNKLVESCNCYEGRRRDVNAKYLSEIIENIGLKNEN